MRTMQIASVTSADARDSLARMKTKWIGLLAPLAVALAGCGGSSGVKPAAVQDALARFDLKVVQSPDPFQETCQNLQPRQADLDAYRAYGFFIVVVSGGKTCDDWQTVDASKDSNGRYWNSEHSIVTEPIAKNVWLHMVLGKGHTQLGDPELAIEKLVKSAMTNL